MRVFIFLFLLFWVYWYKAFDFENYWSDCLSFFGFNYEEICCCHECKCFHDKFDLKKDDYFYFNFEVDPIFVEIPNFLKFFPLIKNFFKNFLFHD
ncbi:MAG: hypothetical protein ACK4GR_04125, partial [bacterium]